MKTTVVNLKFDPYDVYIGRSGHCLDGYFGNPFEIGAVAPFSYNGWRLPDRLLVLPATREDAIEAFRAYFLHRIAVDLSFRNRVLALHGKVLGCFCVPLPCHGQIIAAWVNASVSEGT